MSTWEPIPSAESLHSQRCISFCGFIVHVAEWTAHAFTLNMCLELCKFHLLACSILHHDNHLNGRIDSSSARAIPLNACSQDTSAADSVCHEAEDPQQEAEASLRCATTAPAGEISSACVPQHLEICAFWLTNEQNCLSTTVWSVCRNKEGKTEQNGTCRPPPLAARSVRQWNSKQFSWIAPSANRFRKAQ